MLGAGLGIGDAEAASVLQRRHGLACGFDLRGIDLGQEHAGLDAGPCVTMRLPLVGAASDGRLDALGEPALRIGRYGFEASLVSEMEHDDPALAEPIAPGVPVTRAELRFAVLHEGALTAGDLLDRRFRVGLVTADRSAALAAAEEAIGAASP